MEVEPLWNRLLLFWSDDRSPHEVLSTCQDRDLVKKLEGGRFEATWVSDIGRTYNL